MPRSDYGQVKQVAWYRPRCSRRARRKIDRRKERERERGPGWRPRQAFAAFSRPAIYLFYMASSHLRTVPCRYHETRDRLSKQPDRDAMEFALVQTRARRARLFSSSRSRSSRPGLPILLVPPSPPLPHHSPFSFFPLSPPDPAVSTVFALPISPLRYRRRSPSRLSTPCERCLQLLGFLRDSPVLFIAQTFLFPLRKYAEKGIFIAEKPSVRDPVFYETARREFRFIKFAGTARAFAIVNSFVPRNKMISII